MRKSDYAGRADGRTVLGTSRVRFRCFDLTLSGNSETRGARDRRDKRPLSDAAMAQEVIDGVTVILGDDLDALAWFHEQVDEGTINQAIDVAMAEYIGSPSFPGLAEAFNGESGRTFLMNVTVAIAETFRQERR
jgi:hypothetical protein